MPGRREPRFRQLFHWLPRKNGHRPRYIAVSTALIAAVLAAYLLARPTSAESGRAKRTQVIVRTSDGERVKTLDPVLAGEDRKSVV